MKRILLSLFLLASLSAQVTDKNFKDLAPIVYTLEACDSEYNIPAFKWVMDYG